jgi:hypothetical protein
MKSLGMSQSTLTETRREQFSLAEGACYIDGTLQISSENTCCFQRLRYKKKKMVNQAREWWEQRPREISGHDKE